MKKIVFLYSILLGSMLPSHAQTVWSLEKDTVYLNQSDEGRQIIIEYGIACFQCTMPNRVILLDIHPSLIDSTLNQYVSMELLTPEVLGQRLLDSAYDHMYQKISYRVTFKKVLPRKILNLRVKFDLKLERRAVIIRDEYYSPHVINAKTIVMNPPLVEFYSNPDSSQRMIPVFNGVKSFLVGSYILKNNHPTKKLRVSAIKYGFVDTTSWQYFAGIGQTEQMPHEVPPSTSVAFNFWMQLRSPSHEVAIHPILYLRCWYDDDTTMYDVDALGQPANLSAKALGLNDSPQNQYLVYPNPCTDYLMVTGTQDGPVVVNTLGRKMNIEIERTTTGWKVSTSLLPSGIYFLNKKTKFFKQ